MTGVQTCALPILDDVIYTSDGTNWNSVGGGDLDGGTPTTNYTGNTVINGGTP